ncbi:YdcH family protein [Pokkaliibacter sp. CJK22405]|uniref:YdcH family protein n=1 Tax=Pokkaliibacter sp. CJK22405 TaxID=3384615 RepID=UPI0039849644
MQQHDLVHEFPELRDRIHELKVNDAHFQKLFDEYHDLNREIQKMEAEVQPVSTEREEVCKKQRLKLKDELYGMLKAS